MCVVCECGVEWCDGIWCVVGGVCVWCGWGMGLLCVCGEFVSVYAGAGGDGWVWWIGVDVEWLYVIVGVVVCGCVVVVGSDDGEVGRGDGENGDGERDAGRNVWVDDIGIEVFFVGGGVGDYGVCVVFGGWGNGGDVVWVSVGWGCGWRGGGEGGMEIGDAESGDAGVVRVDWDN